MNYETVDEMTFEESQAIVLTENGGGGTLEAGEWHYDFYYICAEGDTSSIYKTYGANSTEDYLRKKGLGVIHGGKHSIRYTPVFDISTKEVDLIVELTKDALLNGPVRTGN